LKIIAHFFTGLTTNDSVVGFFFVTKIKKKICLILWLTKQNAHFKLNRTHLVLDVDDIPFLDALEEAFFPSGPYFEGEFSLDFAVNVEAATDPGSKLGQKHEQKDAGQEQPNRLHSCRPVMVFTKLLKIILRRCAWS
jgi:hypothetical protein